jgi:hypothetical protein
MRSDASYGLVEASRPSLDGQEAAALLRTGDRRRGGVRPEFSLVYPTARGHAAPDRRRP